MTQFESAWRERLELALRRVAPRPFEESGLDPVKTLRALTGGALLALDEALRRWASHRDKAGSPPSERVDLREHGEEMDAYLFVAACDGNGFVRQNALVAFRKFPCSLAFAAALIRSTDWVPQVREAGIGLINDVLPRLATGDVVRSLDLIARLRDRSRVRLDLTQSIIAPVLATPDGREQLRMAVRDRARPSELRRAAYELLVGDIRELPRVLESAIADPDPRIGFWALDRARALSDPEHRARVLKGAIAADHAAVRQNALRLYAGADLADSREMLRAALFDVSRGVRAFAAFELKRSYDEAALPIWRAAVASTDRKRSDVARLALCEYGDEGDLERVVADLAHRNARIRAGVLRGLLRVGSPQLERVLAQSIFDSSKVVLRELSQVYRRANLTLDALTIDQALARADDRLAENLMSLASLLGKWEELEFLLRHAIEDRGERADAAADRIDHWLRTELRRFTVPSSEQLRRLEPLVHAAQGRYPERHWRGIELSLSVFKAG